jgi:acetyltransferase-like isoleucine patch superfamily enzyme
MRALWLFVWHALVSRLPSYSLRQFWFTRFLGNRCDSPVALHRGLKLFAMGGIHVAADTTINRDVTLDGRGRLDIGRHVSISEGVKILTAGHDIDAADFRLTLAPVRVRDWVWIGANALVMPGVTLGEGAVVGAGSVVTRDVAPYTVVAGSPARFVRSRQVKPDYSPLWKPRLF